MDGDKEREITGCAYFPNTGYVSDPMLATRNVHFAAKHTGKATFRFGKRGDVMSIEYDSSAGRVSGVTLADGSKLSAPVVVNCGGPYSSRITDLAFPEAETAAGRRPGNDMAFTTRALRVEVAAVDAPDNDTYKDAEGSFGPVVTDFDVGTYWRAELGNKIMIGSVEPACDPLHFQDNPDEMPEALTEDHTALIYRCALRLPQLGLGSGTSTQGFAAMCTCVQCGFLLLVNHNAHGLGRVLMLNDVTSFCAPQMMLHPTGRLCTTSRAWQATTWLSGRAATSSRMAPWLLGS